MEETVTVLIAPLNQNWEMPKTLADKLVNFLNNPEVFKAHKGDPYSVWYNFRSLEEQSQIKKRPI
jgi:hypothetical protein